MDINSFLLVIGIIGTVAYGISGALVGIENKLDAFGVVVLGVITATGGGFLRDLILGAYVGENNFVIFAEWWYPLIGFGVSVLVFSIMWFIKELDWEDSLVYRRTYLIVDAIGLGTFVIVGALRAMSFGVQSQAIIIFFSVLTCVGGSMLRDILVCKIPVIFRKHIYAIAAIIGAVYFVFINMTGIDIWISSLTTIAIVVTIRILAAHFKWNFPRIHLKNQE
ncbi:MAG: TRIC cation channel family protein [Acholeplasmatales bacterium]|nr:TRIC cation channel family protein [Acholeplasmatales bacterium]